jgi:mitochondrial import receptor subunit TOM40
MNSHHHHHHHVLDVFTTNYLFDGAKFDLGQPISQMVQLTHTFQLGSQMMPSSYTVAGMMVHDRVFANASLDHGMNMSGRVNYTMVEGVVAKVQGQYAPQAQGLMQYEVDWAGVDGTTNVKAINPTLSLTGIYVLSHLQSLTKALSVGVEVAAQRPDMKTMEMQSSLVGRYRTDRHVLTGNIAQFGVVQMSYYHHLNDHVDLGAEIQVLTQGPKWEGVATVGGKWETGFMTVRCQVDTTGRVTTVMEQKLDQNAALVLTADLDHMKGASKFGMGFQLG